MRFFTKFFSLLLTFILGFVTCAGVVLGAGYYAYAHLSLGKFGVNTDGYVDDEAASVSISDMTIEDLIAEIKTVSSLSETLTLDSLILRYGLVIPEDVNAVIPEGLRSRPLNEVFNEDGIKTVLDGIYFGHVFKYDAIMHEEDGGIRYTWYYPGTDEEIVGINSNLANHTMYEFFSGEFTVDSLLHELTIGCVLEMSSVTDLPVYLSTNSEAPISDIAPITVWYNKDGTPSSALMSAISTVYVDEVQTSLDSLTISDIMGYVEYHGDMYTKSVISDDLGARVVLTPADGTVAEIADLSLKELSSGGLDEKIKDVYVTTALGLTYNDVDGKWYNGAEPVSGVVAVFARNGYKVGELDARLSQMKLGEIADLHEIDGKWYQTYDTENSENNVLADGVLGALANISVNEITDEDALVRYVKTVKVAHALGYKKVDNTWYSVYDEEAPENNVRLTGVMAVIAETEMQNIQAKFDSTLMGELLGYTKRANPEWDGVNPNNRYIWSDESGNDVHVLVNAVSNRAFDSVGDIADTLTVGDVIPADNRTGLISFIDKDTLLDDVADEVDDVLNEQTLGALVGANVVKFENPDGTTDTAKREKFLASSYSAMTLPELLDSLVDEPTT